MKPLITVTLALISLLGSAAATGSTTCEDISLLDQQNKANGALLLWSGCEPITSDTIYERWDQLPELAQLFFASQYKIPKYFCPPRKNLMGGC